MFDGQGLFSSPFRARSLRRNYVGMQRSNGPLKGRGLKIEANGAPKRHNQQVGNHYSCEHLTFGVFLRIAFVCGATVTRKTTQKCNAHYFFGDGSRVSWRRQWTARRISLIERSLILHNLKLARSVIVDQSSKTLNAHDILPSTEINHSLIQRFREETHRLARQNF